jgi:hypothetical protein
LTYIEDLRFAGTGARGGLASFGKIELFWQRTGRVGELASFRRFARRRYAPSLACRAFRRG